MLTFKLEPAQLQRATLWLTWCSPLLYWAPSSTLTISLRFALLLTLAGLVLVYAPLRRQLVANTVSLPKAAWLCLGIFIALAIISTGFGDANTNLKLIGYAQNCLGLISWLAFIIIGLACRDVTVAYLRKPMLLLGAASVLLISIVTDHYLVFDGSYRLEGSLFMATSMGMYAVLSLGLAILQLTLPASKCARFLVSATAVLALACILVSQSRLAFGAAITLLGVLLVVHRRNVLPRVASGLCLVVLITSPFILYQVYDRFASSVVREGGSYRGELYRTSAQEVLQQHLLTGAGAGSLPSYINDQSKAPAALRTTLQQQFIFLSSHNLFLDVAIYYGLIASGALLYLSYAAARHVYLSGRQHAHVLTAGTLLLVAMLNAVVNVPSLELTAIFFVLLLALLPTTQIEK